MSVRSAAGERLRLAILEDFSGSAAEAAPLTDRQRLAVLLQGAALLAHLDQAGLRFTGDWEDVRVDAAGLLRVRRVEVGRGGELPQVVLRRLLRRLFRTSGEISGRGEARRASRQLLQRWQQALVAVSADQAVEDVLEAAPFLWQERFAVARHSLVAEIAADDRGAGADGRGPRWRPWVAGPGWARRRLLAEGRSAAEILALLGGPRARALWDGVAPGDDPERLAAAGHWRRAAAAWRFRGGDDAPSRGQGEALRHARCLHALGRYGEALEVLRGRRGLEERVLRLACQHALGELAAARRGLGSFDRARLSPAATVELAELAVRVEAARGRLDAAAQWVERGLAAGAAAGGDVAVHATVVAALAAWDRGDLAAMEGLLATSEAAAADPAGCPRVAWRWHQARGLLAMSRHDATAAVHHLRAALSRDRRRLLRAEAGRLWNDMAVAYSLADDLAAAERACRHALRLLAGCDGPSVVTLALYNLAEVRLRRGRCRGVQTVLESSTSENRRSGNVRGLIRDLELWVRLELCHGRATAALARCAEARRELEGELPDGRVDVIEVLAARALGWLRRPDAAAACLERGGGRAVSELESEERPAVWALAGRLEEAAAAAAETPWQALWTALASGVHPPVAVWEELRRLEPFRAGRLIHDCELAMPGVVPPVWVRRGIAMLRGSDAEALAEKLEGRSLGPWRAVDRYLESPAADPVAVRELFATAGYDDARVVLTRRGREEVWSEGPGGGERLVATLADGRLELAAGRVDPALSTLFALVRRDLRRASAPGAEPRRPDPSRRGAAGDAESLPEGVVGRSPALRQAFERLDRLAPGELPILVLGESGTGKELVARRAHRVSRRSDGPFLVVNCAALSETLILSDLFGHVRGAFTGADRDHQGVFESARGGTLFLDEIGDLPASAQGKLLRVLQEGEIRRVGESFTRKVDVRVVTATHRDLESMVQAGEFRQDLFFRLKVATVRLPPLRERGDDVLLLAEHFLSRRGGGELSAAARRKILSHPWPGNVRELGNVLEVATALAGDGRIEPRHLDLPESPSREVGGDYHQQVTDYRRRLLRQALEASEGNRAEAARRLGLTRQALSYLVRNLDLV